MIMRAIDETDIYIYIYILVHQKWKKEERTLAAGLTNGRTDGREGILSL